MSGPGEQAGGPQPATPLRPSPFPRVQPTESGSYPPVSPALRAAAFGPPGRTAGGGADPAGRRFADLMATVPNGVGIFDRTGRLVEANPALCGLLGAPPEVLRGVPAARLTAGGAPGPLPGWLRRVPPGPAHGYRVEAAGLLRPDGSHVLCQLDVSVSAAPDGSMVWLVVCTDIGDRLRVAELLRAAGTVDELTRLPTRAAAVALLDRLLAEPSADRIALVCGDLDDFARVNAALGHEAGDDLLVDLAGRLQREAPIGCTTARLAADEFVVICTDHTLAGGPDALARRVAELLHVTVSVDGRPVQLTASVAVVTPSVAARGAAVQGAADGRVRAADLLRYAETALHEVKRGGRGGVGITSPADVEAADRGLALEAELRAAIADDALALQYQPVVAPDGRVTSAEALVRWPHPERGMIPPAEFLPVVARAGLARELDVWVLRAAAREAAGWPGEVAVAVNLAGLLPGEPCFLQTVTDIVTEAGLPWRRLVLELVETGIVELSGHALATMAELAGRGVRFAVDDFGTGYSSLARLKELPAQTVKVDRAFVTEVASDPADFAVARAVVDMAKAMGRTTVAEGVETVEQFHVLRGLGVDAYQGWLFSRPLAAPELRELLAAGRLATPARGSTPVSRSPAPGNQRSQTVSADG